MLYQDVLMRTAVSAIVSLVVRLLMFLLPPTKEEVNALARVRLSVCFSVSKITQKRVHGFGWNLACRQMSGRAWTNWLTFEPDPDYSPDAGTGLLRRYRMRCNAEFYYVGKIPRTGRPLWAPGPSLQRREVLNGFIHREPWEQLCRRYIHALHRVPS